MFLRFKPFEASSVFHFKDPDNGFVYHAVNLVELYKYITLYRQQNGLEPIEELPHVIENYLCNLPENVGKCQENKELKRGIAQYIRGGIALLKNIFFTRCVTIDVAEKRALQCETCKYNVFPDKGPFLAWSDEIAAMQVGERKTSNSAKLGSCEVCTCVIKSKVFFAGVMPKFSDEEVVKMKEVKCWQLDRSGQA